MNTYTLTITAPPTAEQAVVDAALLLAAELDRLGVRWELVGRNVGTGHLLVTFDSSGADKGAARGVGGIIDLEGAGELWEGDGPW